MDRLPNLENYQNNDFDRGKHFAIEVLWRIVSFFIFENPLIPFYGVKRGLLRTFGAKIGSGVLFKPCVKITFPWKLKVEDHVWIGERVWLDNLATIEIERNVVISQGSYLCTGSHDYKSSQFTLRTKPIVVKEGAWLGAFSKIGPGVTIETGAVVQIGGVVTKNLCKNGVYGGNPSELVRMRFGEND